jgi:hypothetical protein
MNYCDWIRVVESEVFVRPSDPVLLELFMEDWFEEVGIVVLYPTPCQGHRCFFTSLLASSAEALAHSLEVRHKDKECDQAHHSWPALRTRPVLRAHRRILEPLDIRIEHVP